MTSGAIRIGTGVIGGLAARRIAIVATRATFVAQGSVVEARRQPGFHLVTGIARRQGLDMAARPWRGLDACGGSVAARARLRCTLQNAVLMAPFAGRRLVRTRQNVPRGGVVEFLLATAWRGCPQASTEEQCEPKEQASPIKLAFHGLLLCVAGRRSPKVVVWWQLAQLLPS
ncbi:MAG: hypothetical protein BWZ07_03271 [Alphaproteobacteria bacterium ADurb.BinA280]|nr:MAG: hypothetical protein BWZ07_03271 [Alphaproteobacteria bacterium ADurb.BinA280]